MATLTSKYWQVFIPGREIQPDVLCSVNPQPTEISPKPVTDQDVQYPLGGGVERRGRRRTGIKLTWSHQHYEDVSRRGKLKEK